MKIGRGSDQAMIRLPDGMRDRLKAAADVNGRSMNAEIVARLEESFELEASLSPAQREERSEWGETFADIYASQDRARRADNQKLESILKTQQMMLDVLVQNLKVLDPNSAALAEHFGDMVSEKLPKKEG